MGFLKLLPKNQIINSDSYCKQLMELDEAIKEEANQKRIMFYQDNAGPHISLGIR